MSLNSNTLNCAISVKRDKQGFCNTIVNGKLRVKQTARIEKTLAVEENLEVYKNVNIHGSIDVKEITTDDLTVNNKLTAENIEVKCLTADKIGATTINTVDLYATGTALFGGGSILIDGNNHIINSTEDLTITTGASGLSAMSIKSDTQEVEILGDLVIDNSKSIYFDNPFNSIISSSGSNDITFSTNTIQRYEMNDTRFKPSLTGINLASASIPWDNMYSNRIYIDRIEPKAVAEGQTGDLYVRFGGNKAINDGGTAVDVRNAWLRFRNGGSGAASAEGIILSRFDTSNYYISTSVAATSVSGITGGFLEIKYNQKLDGSTAAPIGVTGGWENASTILKIDPVGNVTFGGGSILIDGNNHIINSTEDLTITTGNPGSSALLIDSATQNVVIYNDLNVNGTLTTSSIGFTSVSVEYLNVTSVTADTIGATTVNAVDLNITNLNIDTIGATTINAEDIFVNNLVASNIGFTSVTVNSLNVTSLTADTIGATTINVEYIDVTSLTADTIGATTINVEYIDVTSLTADTIGATTINVEYIDVTSLTADTIGATTINVEYIDVTSLTADTIGVTTINAEYIDVTSLTADTIGATTINVENINIENQILFQNPEIIQQSGITATQLKSLSFVNINGTGILDNGTTATDGLYKKIYKTIDGYDALGWRSLSNDDNINNNTINVISYDEYNDEGPYIGGSFTNIAGITGLNYLAKWDKTTSSWTSIKSGGDSIISAFVPTEINGIAFGSLGDGPYICGGFSGIGGQPLVHIARWDGSGWTSISSSSDNFSSIDQGVKTITFDKGNGGPYVGGNWAFKLNNTQNIAKYDSGTDSWTSISGSSDGFNTFVNAINFDSSNNVYVGGNFTAPYNYLAKWDQTSSSWTTVSGSSDGFNTFVNTIDIDSSDNVYVGGNFTTPFNYLAKYDGSGWTSLKSGGDSVNSNVQSIKVDFNDIVIGGNFTSVDSDATLQYIAKFDNLSGSWGSVDPSGDSVNNVVRTINVDNDNHLYIGGSFTSVNGDSTLERFARYDNDELNFKLTYPSKYSSEDTAILKDKGDNIDLLYNNENKVWDKIVNYDYYQNQLGTKFDVNKTNINYVELRENGRAVYSSTNKKTRAMTVNSFKIPNSTNKEIRFGFKIVESTGDATHVGFCLKGSDTRNQSGITKALIGNYVLKQDGLLYENGINKGNIGLTFGPGDTIEYIIRNNNNYNIRKNGREGNNVYPNSNYSSSEPIQPGVYYPQFLDDNSGFSTSYVRLQSSYQYNTLYVNTLVPNIISSGDQYISLEGTSVGDSRNIFLKCRNGGIGAAASSGLLFSRFDNTNYYLSCSVGTTTTSPDGGYLSIRFNDIQYNGTPSSGWSGATPIFQIDPVGNLTAAGSISNSGTITPFTGSHISLSNESGSVEDGLILSSDPEKTDYKTIINSDIYTKVSSTYKDTNVIGVSYNNLEKLETLSLGEGGLMVCSEVIDDVVQTPIKGGDYLCSYFDGYGTVQDDDLLHNYTVAKSLQNYDFDKDYEEFTKDDKTYRKGLIAVTYHCG